MSSVDAIKQAIELLPDDEFVELRRWLSEKDWVKWDSRIEMDSKAGDLVFLAEEAYDQKSKGTLREL
ncbi:MAG: hypothetical protein Q7O66_13990 [Dehalococcoidia bacterium]|nr:hypothetical protein [Dehalococcoidia bacterium]